MMNRFGRVLWTTLVMLTLSAASFSQIGVGIAVSFGPPPLPIYDQPPCPEEGYIWTPGYWAYDNDDADYYWVPGTWVLAPEVGLFWTPGWWGWGGGGFLFHEGYWGPQVGFYGGINYGYGYFGEGYQGGRWDNGRFFYNRSVNNVNITNIHNVYNTTVINNNTVNRVSYNGGNGGITARPSAQDEAAARATHVPPVAVQTQHVQAARNDQQLRASANQGKPPIAATPKPGAFQDRAAVPAKQAGGTYNPPPNRAVAQPPKNNAPVARPENNAASQPNGNTQAARTENNAARPSTAVHPNELPPPARTSPPNTGNAEMDKQYQQQQEQLRSQQAQERQKLQQQQEQEHQQQAQQKADQARQQQMEQQHQQQTQKLQQQHEQQQQQMAHQQQQMQAKQQQPQAQPHQTQKPSKPPQ